jgi:hypothetical protein
MGEARHMTAQQEQDSLDRIKAVLEMTESRGCSQAEASVARDKGRELMRKYLEQSQPLNASTPEHPVSSAESYWDTHTPYYKATTTPPQPSQSPCQQRPRTAGVWADIQATAETYGQEVSARDGLPQHFYRWAHVYAFPVVVAVCVLYKMATHAH